MSSAGKRAAPESSASAEIKRPRTTVSKTPETPQSDSSFEIAVEMSDSFAAYPDKLLEIIQNRHESLIKFIMSKFETSTLFQRHYVYSITRKCISVPRNESCDYDTTRAVTYPAVSFANKQALKEFIVKTPAKKRFVELQIPGMANPQFAERQSVTPDWMSWGFDRHGCISLRLTTIKGGEQKNESIYVERRSIEVPMIREDDETQVVEDPDAARS